MTEADSNPLAVDGRESDRTNRQRSTRIDGLSGLAFSWLDEYRRWLGRQLDAVGAGPVESPFQIVTRKPGVTLRRYAAERTGPVLVIVPAPIKQAYIWDLAPQVSVVRYCLRNGCRVFLIQWQPPPHGRHLGLGEYADGLIADCLGFARAQTRESMVFVAGHSLGGTLAAIVAALHPDWVKGLILVGAPLHFAANVGAIDRLVAAAPMPRVLTSALGNIPGSFLSLISSLADPPTFLWSRWQDYLSSVTDREAMRTYTGVERWTLDEMPLARPLFEEIIELLYRENRFMRGTLTINGRRAAPGLVTAPLLSILDRRCRLVPPKAVLPFHHAVSSTDTKILWYQGDVGVSLQHIGMLVGKQAHARIWPQVVKWMKARWDT